MLESEVKTYQSLKEEFENSGKYRLLLSDKDIKRRIKELAAKISEDYADKCPVFIGVLNGSFLFIADLVNLSFAIALDVVINKDISALSICVKKQIKGGAEI